MKLSSKKIKILISEWLSKSEIRNDLRHHSEVRNPDDIHKGFGGDPDMTWREYANNIFGAPRNYTSEQLEQHIWDMWRDGLQWKREEKHKWGEEADFSESELVSAWHPDPKQRTYKSKPSFPCDMLGEHNTDLVKKFFDDPELGKKCIYRLFVPNNQLADNYRLEVITTPDDAQIVGWWVTVD